MITLTYRGITYRAQTAVSQVVENKATVEPDTNQATSQKKLDYFTYRGVSYIKLPIS